MNAEQNFFWLVGLLEGEGSFMSPPPSRQNEPRVEIEMSDEDTMLKVAALIGVKMQTRNREEKIIYRVRVAGRRAVQLMLALRAFLCLRRRAQIDKALAKYTPPTGFAQAGDLPAYEFNTLCEEPMCAVRVHPAHSHASVAHSGLALAS